MLAFAVPAALCCLILLLFLTEKCLKLERFQVSLSRSRFAQAVAQWMLWGSIPFRVRRPVRSYGVRSAARPRLAFACAFLWVALLAPGVAFLRWRPERAFRAQTWLWSSSRLARAEDFGARFFESALDELEVLMHPKAGSTILAAERLDGLVNVHNAVTGAEVYVNGERYAYEDLCLRRLQGATMSCEFDSVLRLLYPTLPPRPVTSTELSSSAAAASVQAGEQQAQPSSSASASASASFEALTRGLLSPRASMVYAHLEADGVTGVPHRSSEEATAAAATLLVGLRASAPGELLPAYASAAVQRFALREVDEASDGVTSAEWLAICTEWDGAARRAVGDVARTLGALDVVVTSDAVRRHEARLLMLVGGCGLALWWVVVVGPLGAYLTSSMSQLIMQPLRHWGALLLAAALASLCAVGGVGWVLGCGRDGGVELHPSTLLLPLLLLPLMVDSSLVLLGSVEAAWKDNQDDAQVAPRRRRLLPSAPPLPGGVPPPSLPRSW